MRPSHQCLLLSVLLSATSLASAQVKSLPNSPYLAQNTTRTYYLNDLESCPGILDMQAGDLWTLTFPDTITNYFLTRPGLVDVKSQGNRLILAALADTGNIPLEVITENADVPKFMITLKNGPGNRLKDIRILSGSQNVRCQPLATASVPALKAQQVTPSPPPASPAPSRNVTPQVTLIPSSHAAHTSIQVKPPHPPLAPAYATSSRSALTTKAPHAFWNPVNGKAGVAQVYADNAHSLLMTAKPIAERTLRLQLTNTLNVDVTLNLADLNYGNTVSTQHRQIVIAAGKTVTQTVQMNDSVDSTKVKTNQIEWTGRLTQTGEALTLRGRVAL